MKPPAKVKIRRDGDWYTVGVLYDHILSLRPHPDNDEYVYVMFHKDHGVDEVAE